mmetsp:Transcript_11359/g.26358  ORF Transcript_11359/g.26358 Transcript_11359/m.26358 type:complete len:80 (-) Transcript_11359:1880-2119(-)
MFRLFYKIINEEFFLFRMTCRESIAKNLSSTNSSFCLRPSASSPGVLILGNAIECRVVRHRMSVVMSIVKCIVCIGFLV